MANPIVERRRSLDRLISTMGFFVLVKGHLHIESGPRTGTNANLLIGQANSQGKFIFYQKPRKPWAKSRLLWLDMLTTGRQGIDYTQYVCDRYNDVHVRFISRSAVVQSSDISSAKSTVKRDIPGRSHYRISYWLRSYSNNPDADDPSPTLRAQSTREI